MYSDTDYSWYVLSVQTGDEILAFSGRWCQRAQEKGTEGVEAVCFDESGHEILATHFDGKKERVELPADVSLVDGGRAIQLTWRDGRVETRRRCAVTVFTKYGSPIAYPLVGDPDRPSKK